MRKLSLILLILLVLAFSVYAEDEMDVIIRSAKKITWKKDGARMVRRTVVHLLPATAFVLAEVQLETVGGERGNHYTIRASDENDLRPVIVKTVTAHRWDLLELRSRDMDLEEIFRRVVDQSTTSPSTKMNR